jgi:predicted GIY-YIG superfamily endonuclease
MNFRGEVFKEPTVTLFRPVGPKELDLIKALEWKAFPPRLPSQPIFYPVSTEEYARKIAKDWNAKQSGVGHVLEFYVLQSFLDKYPLQTVGGKDHQEYWIPAQDLDVFNQAIQGRIWNIATYYTWYIYILECSDGTLYTGITNDLDKRIAKHNAGKGAKYTRGRGPVTLRSVFKRFSKSEALKLERHIKRLPRDQKLQFNA